MTNIHSLNAFSLKIPYFNGTFSPLADSATLLRAPLFKSEHGNEGEIFRVVSIKDFPEAGYLPVPQREVILQDQAAKAKRYVLKPYDVLVTIVGTIGSVSIVSDTKGDNWIPATNMFIIRLRSGLQEHARAMYGLLKSPAGQEILQTLAHGRGIQIVSKKRFAGVLIPEFTQQLVDRMEELWNDEIRLYHEGLRRLEECRYVYSNIDNRQKQAI